MQTCLLFSFMTLAKFLQDAGQLNLPYWLDIEEEIFQYCFTLDS